ncbi:MAG TPA: hypothetical protein VEQ63_14135, partial [Bryobacteraceae bacterium]|nr:hypothetical protein [Bryobacteraceae bacterium]
SMVFTAFSTLFNLYAMRHGLLIVGEERKSLWDDMKAMPRVLASFLLAGPARLWRLVKGAERRN